MFVRSIRLAMMLLCGGLFWSCSGCGGEPVLPYDVDLAGTWQLNSEGTDQQVDTTLIFDEGGSLTQFTIMVDGTEIITDGAVEMTVTRSGNSIVIDLEFSGNTLNFEGTFTSDSSTVEGELSVQIDTSSVNTTINGGDATMTKQE